MSKLIKQFKKSTLYTHCKLNVLVMTMIDVIAESDLLKKYFKRIVYVTRL